MDRVLLEAVRELVADLADGRFTEIEASGRAGRLTATELQSAIRDYGRKLLPLPDDAASLVDLYPSDTDPNALALDVSLWTAEEGRSDLTLSLEAKRGGDTYGVEISDLHVL